MKYFASIIVITILAIITTSLFADIPDGYYDGTEGLSGNQLKSALNNIIDNHDELGYSGVWNALKDTDEDPNNHNNVILLYTGWSVTDNGYPTWNREHVWAKSHGDFGTSAPCGTDIHHLRPTDPDVNSARGNKDFDNGGVQHSIATGCYYDADSWEPRDEVKGDVARMIFYMATRYEGEHGELDLVVVDEVNTSPSPEHGKLSTLLQWNLQDLPDEFEITRNDRIYENWQGNRNPFIDNPNFASYIWGNVTPDFNANFVADITSGSVPLTVQFTDLSAGEISTWEWDFENDGTIDSNEANPTHIYNNVGTYSVSLVITSTDNETSEKIMTNYIQVNEPGVDPISIYTASFESGEQNWQIISESSDENWHYSNETSGYSSPETVPDGSYYSYINNYDSNQPANDWIISPEIDLSNYLNCYFSFQSWTNFSDTINGLEVKLSTNGIDWIDADATLATSESQSWIESGEISLEDYPSSIYIAFQYQSTGTSGGSCTAWAIDDIKLFGFDLTSTDEELINSNFSLHNYPNPFLIENGRNNGTSISFNISESYRSANIEIYNIKGQKIKDFRLNPNQKINSIYWNGKNNNHKNVSEGIYLIKLIIDKKTADVSKCLIIK